MTILNMPKVYAADARVRKALPGFETPPRDGPLWLWLAIVVPLGAAWLWIPGDELARMLIIRYDAQIIGAEALASAAIGAVWTWIWLKSTRRRYWMTAMFLAVAFLSNALYMARIQGHVEIIQLLPVETLEQMLKSPTRLPIVNDGTRMKT